METDNDDMTVALEGRLTLAATSELRQKLLSSLASSERQLGVDLAGVTDVDLAGLQVLHAARIAAERDGKKWELTGIGDSLRRSAAEFGMTLDGADSASIDGANDEEEGR